MLSAMGTQGYCLTHAVLPEESLERVIRGLGLILFTVHYTSILRSPYKPYSYRFDTTTNWYIIIWSGLLVEPEFKQQTDVDPMMAKTPPTSVSP